MKVLLLTCVLGLAAAQEVVVKYHEHVGIPAATRIMQQESMRITGGLASYTGEHPFLVSLFTVTVFDYITFFLFFFFFFYELSLCIIKILTTIFTFRQQYQVVIDNRLHLLSFVTSFKNKIILIRNSYYTVVCDSPSL